MRLGCVYTLEDPETGLVRYVGKTAVRPERRYAQHIYQWKRTLDRLTHVNAWIKSLYDRGLKLVMNILDSGLSLEVLGAKEMDYIKLFKAVGAVLCNHTLGGEGTIGYKFTEDSKQKRLKTLSTSLAWKEKHKRHSEIMKNKYKTGAIIPSVYLYSPEKRFRANKAISEAGKKPLKILNKITGEILEFDGIIDFSKYLGYAAASSVSDFLYSKRKTHLARKFQVLEIKQKRKSKKK